MLNKTKGSKEACRSLTYHNNLLAFAHIWVFRYGICKVCRFLINVCTHGKVDIYLTLTRINATTNNTNSLDCTCINSFLFGYIIDDKRRVGCYLGQYTKLNVLNHIMYNLLFTMYNLIKMKKGSHISVRTFAVRTRLELVTSSVTGWHSNQLN